MNKPKIFKLMKDFGNKDISEILENIRKTLNGNAEALNEVYKVLEKHEKEIDNLKKGDKKSD